MNRIYLTISAWEDAEPEIYQNNQTEELHEKFFDDTEDEESYDY